MNPQEVRGLLQGSYRTNCLLSNAVDQHTEETSVTIDEPNHIGSSLTLQKAKVGRNPLLIVNVQQPPERSTKDPLARSWTEDRRLNGFEQVRPTSAVLVEFLKFEPRF